MNFQVRMIDMKFIENSNNFAPNKNNICITLKKETIQSETKEFSSESSISDLGNAANDAFIISEGEVFETNNYDASFQTESDFIDKNFLKEFQLKKNNILSIVTDIEKKIKDIKIEWCLL